MGRMQRVHVAVTIALGAAAALWWAYVSILPSLGVETALVYDALQVPLGYALTFAACFGWLLVWLGERKRESETRCRRCGYVLRGISEPRCPECGERI